MTNPDAINEKHLITTFHLGQMIEIADSCNFEHQKRQGVDVPCLFRFAF